MLSERQRSFASAVAQGEAINSAYIKSYPDSKPKSANANGCRLSKHPGVVEEVARLRERAQDESVLSLLERRRILRGIAEDTEQPPQARISAMTLDSRLAGDLDSANSLKIESSGSLNAVLALFDNMEPLPPNFDWNSEEHETIQIG